MVAFVILLVCIAIALFTYTLVSAPGGTSPEALKNDEQNTSTSPNDSSRLITAKHQYRGGVHTVAGTVDMPTPCHKLVVEPFFTKPGEEVELRFNTVAPGEDCAQVVTSTPFKVTFEAPETVRITGAQDKVPVRLNLLPVDPGSSIDDDSHVKG